MAAKTGLPAPQDHFARMQTIALRLEMMLSAANILQNETCNLGEAIAITEVAEELARELNAGLDSSRLSRLEGVA
ncbi:hypothetical protein [Rhodobacteraceae bacterium DSL-40]|uniref:hypothetical protein n=1 Tax=Amaricoccus sp. B4 TaxID=3368557 RepID=UPI000DAC9CFE